jgi:photoactive yellow protein
MQQQQQRPTFEAPETIASLPESALDEQPFGIIRLDRTGRVLSFNTYEEKLARKARADVIGKNFFVDVAPCTRVKEFYGKFLEGIEQRYLNTTFAFVFAFSFGHRGVHVSLYYKQADDTIWVLVRGG